MEKIPIKLIENHDQAYHFWKKLGILNKPLIHFDAHIDFNLLPVKPLRQTLKEAESKQDLLRQLSRNLAYKQLNIKEESFTNIRNYIYPALREGIISDFWWVIPGHSLEFTDFLKYLRKISRSYFSCDPLGIGKIMQYRGRWKAEIYGHNFVVTTLADLPEDFGEAIVDIDCDYLTTETITEVAVTQKIGRRFPWIWPQEFVRQLKEKKIRPCCVSIAYSVDGGFTPLLYKFLGDEIALFLQRVTKDLIQFMNLRSKALILWRKGRAKEAINLLHELLQDLDNITLSKNLKNRLRAHLSFILFRCLAKRNDLTGARYYYNLAVDADNTYRAKDNNYGPLYLRRKKGLHKAEQEFDLILAVDRKNSYALSGLGNVWVRRKDFQKAKIFFARASSEDRKNQEALFGLGQVEFFLQNYKTALGYLQSYRLKNRMHAVSYSLLAQAYERLGLFDKALREYKLALHFGMDLKLYLRFFKLLRTRGIPLRHKKWIESRIKAYRSYIGSLKKLPYNSQIDISKRVRLIKLVDDEVDMINSRGIKFVDMRYHMRYHL